MCGLACIPVDQLEQHRVCDVEPGQLVEGRGWQEHFATKIDARSLRAAHHDDGIAPVIFIELSRRHTDWGSASHEGRVTGHISLVVRLQKSVLV